MWFIKSVAYFMVFLYVNPSLGMTPPTEDPEAAVTRIFSPESMFTGPIEAAYLEANVRRSATHSNSAVAEEIRKLARIIDLDNQKRRNAEDALRVQKAHAAEEAERAQEIENRRNCCFNCFNSVIALASLGLSVYSTYASTHSKES